MNHVRRSIELTPFPDTALNIMFRGAYMNETIESSLEEKILFSQHTTSSGGKQLPRTSFRVVYGVADAE